MLLPWKSQSLARWGAPSSHIATIRYPPRNEVGVDSDARRGVWSPRLVKRRTVNPGGGITR